MRLGKAEIARLEFNILVLIAVASWAALTFGADPQLPREPDTAVVPPTNRGTFTPRTSGEFQAALNASVGGDRIVLQAGQEYVGHFTCPHKPTGVVVVESSSYGEMPDGTVTPSHNRWMPRIVSPDAQPTMIVGFGAHHWRFRGLEITTRHATTASTNYGIVRVGAEGDPAETLDQLAGDVFFEKCWIHGTPTGNIRRALTLDGVNAGVIDSLITDCHEVGADSQGIWSLHGGRLLVEGCLIEAAGENIMTGGADPQIPDLLPTDVTIRRCYLTKPDRWKDESWTVKNLLEFKIVRRALVEDCFLDNCWTSGQDGHAILITPRNQYGSRPDSICQDITIRNCRILRCERGIDIGIADDEQTSMPTTRVLIENIHADGLLKSMFLILNNSPGNEVASDIHIRNCSWTWRTGAQPTANFFMIGDRPQTAIRGFTIANCRGDIGGWGLYAGNAGHNAAGLETYLDDWYWYDNELTGPADLLANLPEDRRPDPVDPPDPPPAGNRLRPDDLTYIGVYRAPIYSDRVATSAYGHGSFTYSDGLFYASNINRVNDNESKVYAYTLPSEEPVVVDWASDWEVSDIPVGQRVMGFHNVVGGIGHRSIHGPYNKNLTLKQMLVRGDDLFATTYFDYNVVNENFPHLLRSPQTLDGSSRDRDPPRHYGDFKGIWYFSRPDGTRYQMEAIAGYMTPIPDDVSREYLDGKDVLVGNSLTWRANASNGPAAHAFKLSDTKRPSGEWKWMHEKIEAQHLLSYVKIEGHDGPSFWTGVNSAFGIVVKVEDRIGLLFFGRQGDINKRIYYSNPDQFLRRFGYRSIATGLGYNADLPPTAEEVQEATGYASYEEGLEAFRRGDVEILPSPRIPFESKIWFYDFHALATQEGGSHDAEPYEIQDITMRMYPHRLREITGIAWDDERQRIYICQKYTYSSRGVPQPLIHVWQVGDPDQPPVRDQELVIPLTEEELDTIESAAEQEGESPEDWARERLLP